MSAFLICLSILLQAPGGPKLLPVGDGNPGGNPAADVGIDQNLDQQLSLDLPFTDSTGAEVTLRKYFDERPVVLVFVYYECPMLCTEVLNGFVRSLRAMKFTPGVDFDIVTVGIDPGESSQLAAAKKESYLKRLGREGAGRGWHFLTGDQDSITKLADEAGFRYRYVEEQDLYAHSSGIMVVTPEGRMSRYFYGIEFSPRDLRLALVEASDGKIGTFADKVTLLCLVWDPDTSQYGTAVITFVRIGGVLTVLALALFFTISIRRERRNKPSEAVTS